MADVEAFYSETDDQPFIRNIDDDEESVYSSDSDETPVNNESESVESSTQQSKGKKRSTNARKRGRKAKWSDDWTDDLVDIICNNEIYQKKLIFTNTKTAKNGQYYAKIIKELEKRCMERGEVFTYNVNQTREKFKRCMSECKKASLTMKTASGIKRFQESKGYGKWFSCLLPLVQSRVSCQPEQALDPSSVIKKRKVSLPESDSSSARSVSPCWSTGRDEGNIINDMSDKDDEKEDERDVNEKENSGEDGLGIFVPVKKRKCIKATEMEESIKRALEKATETLEKDNMGNLLNFFEKQNDLARQHEMNLFRMMFGQSNQMTPLPQPWQPYTTTTNPANVQMDQNVYNTNMIPGFQAPNPASVQMDENVYHRNMIQDFQAQDQFQNGQQSFPQQQSDEKKYFSL